ncbi:MAG: MFS transporter [Tepidisphaeraceae bacterium]
MDLYPVETADPARLPPHPPLTAGVVRLLALAAGLTVANIYYNQALLPEMGQTLHVSAAAIGAIAMVTQLGYATGLLFLVPLGDSIDRRKMIIAAALSAAGLLLMLAAAPSYLMAMLASYLMGVINITPILTVAYGASMAEPTKRGRTVGTIMSGLLIGVLFSRSAAGFIGAWLGWRAVFELGSGLTLAIGLILFLLPRAPRPTNPPSYKELIGSLLPITLREPSLRLHAFLGGVGFAAFSVFWTTLAFYLEARPEHYGGRAMGMFGLVAIAGAMAAPVSGHLSDRLSAKLVNGASLVLMMGSFLMMGLSAYSLAWLVLAVFLMDAGAQASHISNQTRVMGISPALRNRTTSVYMVSYFVGGAIGSAIGAQVWEYFHWTGVWSSAAVMVAVALVVLMLSADPEPGVALDDDAVVAH